MAGKLTEEAIKNAYLQLLEEKPMDKITISEISLTLQSRVNDLQDKPEGLDVSVLPIGTVSGLPVAPHPYG